MLKYKAIKKLLLDEDKIFAHQDFDLVLARMNDGAPKRKKTILRTLLSNNWSIAACIVVMVSTLSYAVYVLMPPKLKEKVKSSLPQLLRKDLNERFEIPYHKNVEIISTDSIKLEIANYSLLPVAQHSKNAVITISPLYHKNMELQKPFDKSVQFYIDFKNYDQQPITVTLLNQKAKQFVCYYGGVGAKAGKWNTFSAVNFIYKPTTEMQLYKDYLTAKEQIANIKQKYTLVGEVYSSKDDSFTYSKSFVDSMTKKVAEYGNQPNAFLKMQMAEKYWKKYNAQQIKIEYSTNEKVDEQMVLFEINKAGWYRVDLE